MLQKRNFQAENEMYDCVLELKQFVENNPQEFNHDD